MAQQLSDPSWKSGPVESTPNSSDHAIDPHDFGETYDLDGFGVDEAEIVEGTPLVTIQEASFCSRDGCDAAHWRRFLFTTEGLDDDKENRLRQSVGCEDDESLAEYVFDNAERVNIDAIEVDGITIAAERTVEDEATGGCYGRVEPSPNVDAHRYDL
jgi:hypothetical protein